MDKTRLNGKLNIHSLDLPSQNLRQRVKACLSSSGQKLLQSRLHDLLYNYLVKQEVNKSLFVDPA